MRPRDPRRPALADDDGVVLAQRPDDPRASSAPGAGVVPARRLVAGAVAPQVHARRPATRRRRSPPSGAATCTRTAGTRAAAAPSGRPPARPRGTGHRWPRRTGGATARRRGPATASRVIGTWAPGPVAWRSSRRGSRSSRPDLRAPSLVGLRSLASDRARSGSRLDLVQAVPADQGQDRGDEEEHDRPDEEARPTAGARSRCTCDRVRNRKPEPEQRENAAPCEHPRALAGDPGAAP